MIHQASGLLFGNMQELEESLEEIHRTNDILFKIITDKTKIKQETLSELIQHKRDWYLTAQEALDLGLITEIVYP
jgi:ATP-dependent Clp protease protease subunit